MKENSAASAQDAAARLVVIRKEADSAKKAAKLAKQACRLAKKELKEAKRTAKKLRKEVKALEAQLAARPARVRQARSRKTLVVKPRPLALRGPAVAPVAGETTKVAAPADPVA